MREGTILLSSLTRSVVRDEKKPVRGEGVRAIVWFRRNTARWTRQRIENAKMIKQYLYLTKLSLVVQVLEHL